MPTETKREVFLDFVRHVAEDLAIECGGTAQNWVEHLLHGAVDTNGRKIDWLERYDDAISELELRSDQCPQDTSVGASHYPSLRDEEGWGETRPTQLTEAEVEEIRRKMIVFYPALRGT